jgi:hypothetical protein
MSEFEFLDKMFRRLAECRHHRALDEAKMQPIKIGRKMVMPHSPYETAEIMIEASIKDYLQVRHDEAN